jgi:hypothetical protein
MSVGKTPSKDKARGLGQTSAEKGSYPSPQRLRFADVGSPDKAASEDRPNEDMGNTKEVRELLRDLDEGIHDKVSLLKILILKCTEADSNYKKIRVCFNKGDINTAEK